MNLIQNHTQDTRVCDHEKKNENNYSCENVAANLDKMTRYGILIDYFVYKSCR